MSQTQIPHPDARNKTSSLKVHGLDCAGCAAKLEKKLARTPGVEFVRVSFGTGKLTVRHTLPLDRIISLVKKQAMMLNRKSLACRKPPELSIYQ